MFCVEKDLAMCGLACVLCSVTDCPGCKARGCAGASDCSVYRCATEKGLDGCYQCDDFPCGEKMLQGVRNRAFNRYTQQFGKAALLERLRINQENGIVYHRPDGLKGDYDAPETEEDMLRLIRFGHRDPYVKCPEFETAHFRLRQVREEDAEALLRAFYGDLSAWMFYGNEMCNSIFAGRYATLDEMKKCIRVWLAVYADRFFIRLTVLDKKSETPIGTIEIFDNIHSEDNWKQEEARHGLVLHMDLAEHCEKQAYIAELLDLADREINEIFGFDHILIRAAPEAGERIAALRDAGYVPFAWEPGREHYYVKRRYPQGD